MYAWSSLSLWELFVLRNRLKCLIDLIVPSQCLTCIELCHRALSSLLLHLYEWEDREDNEEREFAEVQRYLTDGIYRWCTLMKKESFTKKSKQGWIPAVISTSLTCEHELRALYFNVCSNGGEVGYCAEKLSLHDSNNQLYSFKYYRFTVDD